MRRHFENLTLGRLDFPAKLISKLAGQMWKSGHSPIILLSGKMGAGKTTFASKFVSGLLDSLGDGTDKKTLFVNSPTYTLINEYPFLGTKNVSNEVLTVYHFDLFRLGSSEEITDLGFEEYWGRQGICLIEWWEKAESEFKTLKYSIKVVLEELEEETRNVDVELVGTEWNDSGVLDQFHSFSEIA